MKFLFIILFAFQFSLLSQASQNAELRFDKNYCVAQMNKNRARTSEALCKLHEMQFPHVKLLNSAIYRYEYSTCGLLTGDIVRASNVSVPCVSYIVENEFQKSYVILSLFGRTARAPLNYNGLYINVSVVPRQLQMQ